MNKQFLIGLRGSSNNKNDKVSAEKEKAYRKKRWKIYLPATDRGVLRILNCYNQNTLVFADLIMFVHKLEQI